VSKCLVSAFLCVSMFALATSGEPLGRALPTNDNWPWRSFPPWIQSVRQSEALLFRTLRSLPADMETAIRPRGLDSASSRGTPNAA